uniref:Cysteine desulfurase n=1 Tax=Meloidogyne incognita TaxID=6306 RepID=A0A914L5L9_MELIC
MIICLYLCKFGTFICAARYRQQLNYLLIYLFMSLICALKTWIFFCALKLCFKDLDLKTHSSIRFGIGRFTTEEEVDFTMSPLWEMVQEGIDLKTIKWTQH